MSTDLPDILCRNNSANKYTLLIFTNTDYNMQSNVTQKYSLTTFGTHGQSVYLYSYSRKFKRLQNFKI